MCEYYEHTGDRRFLQDVLLPCADEFVKFYELHFPKRDAFGKMVMEPASVVSFKLHAAGNTTIECEYRDGKVQSLAVTPESRRADIVDMTTLENRVRTLVGVACADRNYLFGLPPMLDGLPKSGKTTAPWLAQYGESVAGVRAGPRPGCVFRDNIVFLLCRDSALIVSTLAPAPGCSGGDRSPAIPVSKFAETLNRASCRTRGSSGSGSGP